MPTDAQDTPHITPALEFKSSTFSVPVLVLTTVDLLVIEELLQKKIQLAPDFFKNLPLVFDVQLLNKQQLDIDIAQLVDIIRTAGLFPIGIRGGSELQNKQAIALHIPVYSIHSNLTAEPKKSEETPQKTEAIVSEPAAHTQATIITQPVRSGQRIYATGDLIILAQVSPGAEIMAEGNIHVYSTLRGRALAGVQGNVDARIFCSHLEAELISIAGTYKISEDMRGVVSSKPVQIYLQKHALIIKDIA